MIEANHRLNPSPVPAGINLVSPERDPEKKTSENSPAINVMTDLKIIRPFQIEASASLDAINEKMIACGVRLLFVHDKQQALTGLITSNDILGEKPLLFSTHNRCSRHDIEAKDMMTPISKLEAIPLEALEDATVADVVIALEASRRHHMLVLQQKEGRNCVRGIISVTQVARQLGKEITPSQRASSFAQLNRALG
jgi:CBS-domain-containing membrane protein